MMRAIERRVARLEARSASQTPPIIALLHIVGNDGETVAIWAPNEGGGWRSATEEEISAAAVTMDDGDLGVL